MAKKGQPNHVLTPEEGAKGKATQLVEAHKDVEVTFPILSLKDCAKEETLQFCLSELSAGTTYNDLRRKLGLGPMHLDGRWRKIRRLLSEMVLPKDEEDAVLAGYSSTQFAIKKMERFLHRLEKKLPGIEGSKNEHHFWQLELDALRALIEKQETRTDHYLKMKELQKTEKGRRGATIIFQNNFAIPRPGEVPKDITPLQDAARLAGQLHDLEEEEFDE